MRSSQNIGWPIRSDELHNRMSVLEVVLFQLTVTKTKSTFSKVNIFKLTKTKTVTKNECI